MASSNSNANGNGSGTKLAFSFNAPSSSSSAASKAKSTPPAFQLNSAASGSTAAPMSNLELLLAKAKTSSPAVAASGSSKFSSKAQAAPPRPAKPVLFDDDEDESDGFPTSSAGPSKLGGLNVPGRNKTKPSIGQSNLLSRSERKAQAAAEAIDQSIFDYDTHYDHMKAAERAVEESKKKETEERKPKYIENFLASAQTRRLDKLRAEEKSLQRERENEGDEFGDKEKFVTEGYKKQMEEVRQAEEEEKIREEAMRKSKSGPGLTSFYKSMLDSDEAKHAAAVAATTAPPSTAVAGPSLAIRPPTGPAREDEEPRRSLYDDEEEYDPFLASEAKASANAGIHDGAGVRSGSETKGKAGSSRIDADSGKEVEINDNGEVIDKRSLLKAGLNITKKPNALPNSLLTSSRSGNSASTNEPYKSRAVGTAASHAERMERERRRLADQLHDENERKRKAEQERLQKEEDEAKKRREGDNGEAEKKRLEARERFLARKRQREEEAKNGGAKKAKEDK